MAFAFDLEEDEDEFGINQQTLPSSKALPSNNTTESKEYVGLCRRNLQSDSEEKSEAEEGSDERHFKRRLRRKRSHSYEKGEEKGRVRSRSRSIEGRRRKSSEAE